MKIKDIDNGFEVRTNKNKLSRTYKIHEKTCLVTIHGNRPSKFVFLDNEENALTTICGLRIMEECANVSSW